MSKKTSSSDEDEKIIGVDPELDLNQVNFEEVIEHGIKKLVSVLWERNYHTVCSCAGHTKALEPLPWIVILIDESNPEHLLKLFSAVGRFNLSLGKKGKLPKPDKLWVLVPQMTAGGLAVYLRPHSLNKEESKQEINRLRRLGEKLASFMKEKCNDIFYP